MTAALKAKAGPGMTSALADSMERVLTSLDNAVQAIRVIATPSDAIKIDEQARAALRLVADAMSHDLNRLDGLLIKARDEEVAS